MDTTGLIKTTVMTHHVADSRVKKVVKRLTASRQLDSNLKGENMRGRIDFDKFKQYALDLLKEGTKICPCCLSRSILFTTDENHNEFEQRHYLLNQMRNVHKSLKVGFLLHQTHLFPHL